MQEVIILKGIPASGKSTFAKDLIKKNPEKYKRINKDDLRSMLDNSKWTPDNEKFITDTRDYLILQALRKNYSVIVDDTNLHSKHENKIMDIVKNYCNITNKQISVLTKPSHQRQNENKLIKKEQNGTN